jgi:hypothetical protein
MDCHRSRNSMTIRQIKPSSRLLFRCHDFWTVSRRCTTCGTKPGSRANWSYVLGSRRLGAQDALLPDMRVIWRHALVRPSQLVQVSQDRPHRHRPFADGAGYPLHGIVPDVADREYTWRAGLER